MKVGDTFQIVLNTVTTSGASAASRAGNNKCTISCNVQRTGALYDLSAKWNDDMAFFCTEPGV